MRRTVETILGLAVGGAVGYGTFWVLDHYTPLFQHGVGASSLGSLQIGSGEPLLTTGSLPASSGSSPNGSSAGAPAGHSANADCPARIWSYAPSVYSPCVVIIQAALNRYGLAYAYPNGMIPINEDGYFGPDTLADVKAFQAANGLTVDGIVGPATWSALLNPSPPVTTLNSGASTAGSPSECPSVPLVPGSSGPCVRVLQQDLNTIGSHVLSLSGNPLLLLFANDGTPGALTVDGSFGSNTLYAVQQLQQVAGLSPTGTVGPRTWTAIQALLQAIAQGQTPTAVQVPQVILQALQNAGP